MIEEQPVRTDALAKTVVTLSRQLVALMRPLRILEAVRWGSEVEAEFLANGGRLAPRVKVDGYPPLRFDPARHILLLDDFQRQLKLTIGSHPAGRLMTTIAGGARRVVELLVARGTPRFSKLSAELFDNPDTHPDAGRMLARLIPAAGGEAKSQLTALSVKRQLADRLCSRFAADAIRVRLSSRISADAVAAGLAVRVRRDADFSVADVDALEVHEGWVHLGTTVNARSQPYCSFLTVCTPAGTRTQEGLAVLAELLAGVAHPGRLRRLAERFEAVRMAARGADFMMVYRYFLDCGCDPREAYRRAARVFRGSLPAAGPFAKDASYVIGLMQLIGRPVMRFDLLMAGKSAWEWATELEALKSEGLLRPPVFFPPVFSNAGRRLAELRLRAGAYRQPS